MRAIPSDRVPSQSSASVAYVAVMPSGSAPAHPEQGFLRLAKEYGVSRLEQGRDLLEVLDDRHGRASTIVTSQLPVDHWHELIGNPTVADAA